MIRHVRNTLRLFSLARLLARHDALFMLEGVRAATPLVMAARLAYRRNEGGRPGQRLARALHDAGPSFIKLGQALSTRSDLLGDEAAADLSQLQDRLPPFSGAQARAIIERELGRPVNVLFNSFDDQPVAAASIAQVHFAEDAEGRPVAVKVLRPNVELAFKRDLDLFLWGAELIEDTMPAMRRLRPIETIRTFAESVAMEMDLRFEAAAACELAENFSADPNFKVPAVDWSRTAQRVLTTERIIGLPVDKPEVLIRAGLDPQEILTRAATMFFFQVFRDGFFHADLHPGNMFVCADGAIATVDFGIMGRLDRDTRRHLGEMLLAFLTRNYRRAAEVHFEAGWIPADRSVDTFAQACRSIAEPILDKPQNEISVAHLLGQLFQITETFSMSTQPQLLLLQKTMLLAEGTGRRLCPDANMWLLARPLIQEWIAKTYSPEQRVRQLFGEMAETVERLPDNLLDLERGIRRLADGRLRLDPETVAALNAGRNGGALSWLPWLIVILALIALVFN